MRAFPFLIAAAALGSCTASPPEPGHGSSAAARSERLLAGMVARPPVSCMPTRGYSDMIVLDEKRIAFRTGADRIYVTHMRGGCSGLSGAGSYALVTRQAGTSGYCEGDIADVVDTLNHFTIGSCVFGEFTPYVRAR